MNKNLMLVYPKSNYGDMRMSLALLYLSGASREICDDIFIYDFNIPNNGSMEDFKDAIRLHQPSVIGINCPFSEIFPCVIEVATHVRKLDVNIKIVIGGIHPTMYANDIMKNCDCFDAVVIGEGERSFIKLLHYWYGEADENELEGLVLRDNAGVCKTFPVINYIENLDEIPMPGYEFINMKDYEVDRTMWYNPNNVVISSVQMPLLTSRSCPNKCRFCNMRFVMGDRCRMRSPESVLNEIIHLYEAYGINCFDILDDNFTINKKRTIEILTMIINSGIKFRFETPNGLMINTLDEEIIALMAKAGFVLVRIAVESGSEYIRSKVVGKPIPEKKIYEVASLFKKYGIGVAPFFIVGFPEDTDETLSATLEMINKMEIDYVNPMVLTPFPGTAIYEQCKKDSLFINDFHIISSELYKGAITGSLKKTVGERCTLEDFYIKPYNLSVDELLEWYNRICDIAEVKSAKWLERTRNAQNT